MSSVLSPVVWVTGASRGIGSSIGEAFASVGSHVALSARSAAPLDRVAKKIAAADGIAIPVPCDVRSPGSISRAHKIILSKLGAVDVLVNNAAITYFKRFDRTSLKDFDLLLGTNLRGPFLCTQAVLPAMLKRKRGTIINIISVSATTTFRDSSVYSASKAGLLAMTRCLRAEVREDGVRVIDVIPGAVDTAMWPDRVRKRHGVRMMRPAEVAEAVLSAYSLPDSILAEELVLRPKLGDL
ncbi:MAG TPA: SDR family oxidoreductase [Bacteroidota bacterium]|nr:SDR family oxidoreductase [Bacteroidota bacterium]